MRTTLNIDDDVLQAARELSARHRKTAGKLISEWARRGIGAGTEKPPAPCMKNGFEVLPAEGRVVANEFVRRLLDETEDTSLLSLTAPLGS